MESGCCRPSKGEGIPGFTESSQQNCLLETVADARGQQEVVNPPNELPSSIQENHDVENNGAAPGPSQQEETVVAGPQPAVEVPWIIGNESSSYTDFIKDLRIILAGHDNPEDICDIQPPDREHPLLAKPCAEQQPARWIHIKLRVVKGSKTSFTTLVMRDDNVDVMGFINQNGHLYELGYRRTMLPPDEFNSSVLLRWGNSYKDILSARNVEEVMDGLVSAKLGKTFAMRAVRVLSRFRPDVVHHRHNPRLAVVGLMFMISESAKMNPVHQAIARGWDDGTGFTKQLMTDYVSKYVEMSTRLRQWKGRNYADPHPHEELAAIYLVPSNEEYTMSKGELLLPFAYPGMLTASFPEMFKEVSMATVKVNLRRDKNRDIESIYGKITALISDEHRHSVPFRVGSMLFPPTEGISSSHAPLKLARDVVPVPSGWVLGIELDLHIEIPDVNQEHHGKKKRKKGNNTIQHFKVTFHFDKRTSSCVKNWPIDTAIEVEVKITWGHRDCFTTQLSRPVEVLMETKSLEYLTVVYTVGDEMSFTEFIQALRRILAEHPDREDILDGHSLLNLYSTREHPLLPKKRAEQPARWLHIKLQVKEGEKEFSTTLVMRDDNLYVYGFFNQNEEVLYRLLEINNDSASSIPEGYHNQTQDLRWGFSYISFLEVNRDQKEHEKVEKIAEKLTAKKLGSVFAKHAVSVLSQYKHVVDVDDCQTREAVALAQTCREALAGLVVMFCESARMNPLHNSIAVGWDKDNGTEFTKELVGGYLWNYEDMSEDLRTWKIGGYAKRPKWKSRDKSLPKDKKEDNHSKLQTSGDKSLQENKVTHPDSQLVHEKEEMHPNALLEGVSGDNSLQENKGTPSQKQKKESEGTHPVSQLQAIYLVLPAPQPPAKRKQKRTNKSTNSRDDQTNKKDNDESSTKPPEANNQTREEDDKTRKANDQTSGQDNEESSSQTPEDNDPSQEAEEQTKEEDSDQTSVEDSDQTSAEDSDQTREEDCDQTSEAEDAQQGLGRPMVELLAMSADLGVVGRNIIVFDGKRGQIIYRKPEQEAQQGIMVELVLTGPYTGISAYGCFAIRIDTKATTAAGSSRRNAFGPIKWEWDGYDPKYAAQVDKGPMSHPICTPDTCEVAKVTYAVMSNALEATVQVKFRLKDKHNVAGIGGEISAHIDSFEDKYRSVLFRCAEGTRPCFLPTDDKSWFVLQLARNVVAVPCGSNLHINLNLSTKISNIEDAKHLDVTLDFDNGTPSQYHEVDGEKVVEVEISWYPKMEIATGHRPEQISKVVDEQKFFSAQEPSHPAELALPSQQPEQITSNVDDEEKFHTAPSTPSGQPEISLPSHPSDQITCKVADEENFLHTAPSEQSVLPEVKTVPEHLSVVYTIGDVLSFIEFITDLRRILADQKDAFDKHPKFLSLSLMGEHHMLAKQSAEQPAKWVHVKLQAVKGEETSSTTLLMRGDNLYICGFMNQQGHSFGLIDNPNGSIDIVPVNEYNPQRLSWGISYRSLLDAISEDEVMQILACMRVGYDFAMNAVHVLSHFPAWLHGMNPRMALAGLIFMVCESARMNPIHNFIVRWWSNKDMKFSEDLIRDYVLKYGRTSHELLAWKSKGYANPYPISQLQDICLVLNHYCLDPPQQGNGRPRVELLGIRADLGVRGTTIMVFDGKRGHIIYRKEDEQGEQGEKGMVDLVLTGPHTSISAYGCFAIKIDIPPGAAAGSSSGDAGGSSIKWEWDCYDLKFADEVDKSPRTHTISSSGPGRNVEVKYAVMSNALEAKVHVKLWLKDWNSPSIVHGKITAYIADYFKDDDGIILDYFKDDDGIILDYFKDDDGIILFRRAQGMGQRLSRNDSRVLQLARSVVAVPCGKLLHIKLDLQLETSNNKGVNKRHLNTTLSFANGILSRRHEADGDQVEVHVAWYPTCIPASSDEPSRRTERIEPSERQPDISYMVGDDVEGFSIFITELRRLLADHPHCKDVMDEDPELSTRDHPVLPKVRDNWRRQDGSLFHIKLEAMEGMETSSITLVLRDDNLDIIGFMNKSGDCYDPGFGELPPEYNSKNHSRRNSWQRIYDWGPYYGSIVNARGREQVQNILGFEKLGKAFAAQAVSVLSRYPNGLSTDNPYLELVRLIVMVCDSARIKPVHDAIASGWNNGTVLTKQLKDLRRNWLVISGALLDWRDHGYKGWPQDTTLQSIGITSSEAALKAVHLVFNAQDRLIKTY